MFRSFLFTSADQNNSVKEVLIRESPSQFENRIMPRVFIRSIIIMFMYKGQYKLSYIKRPTKNKLSYLERTTWAQVRLHVTKCPI